MNRNLLILLLTFFQDNYVRLGTIAGTLVGIGVREFCKANQEQILLFSDS